MKECGYCQLFLDIPTSRREDDGKTHKRWCTKVKRYVEYKEMACSFFEIPKRFWCDRRLQWVVPIACINTQDKRRDECKHCSQGKVVIDFMRRVPGRPRLINSPIDNRPSLRRIDDGGEQEQSIG